MAKTPSASAATRAVPRACAGATRVVLFAHALFRRVITAIGHTESKGLATTMNNMIAFPQSAVMSFSGICSKRALSYLQRRSVLQSSIGDGLGRVCNVLKYFVPILLNVALLGYGTRATSSATHRKSGLMAQSDHFHHPRGADPMFSRTTNSPSAAPPTVHSYGG